MDPSQVKAILEPSGEISGRIGQSICSATSGVVNSSRARTSAVVANLVVNGAPLGDRPSLSCGGSRGNPTLDDEGIDGQSSRRETIAELKGKTWYLRMNPP